MRIVIAILCALFCATAGADGIPRDAYRYQRTLVREARAAFGMDAPVAVFAAQIHQESRWRPGAISHVGARGMAQFMPGTEQWINDAFPELFADLDGGAMNPAWSIRALIHYDAWLRNRVWGDSEFDMLWAALRAYNGGLGHWRAEAAKASPSIDRAAIDAQCGRAKRSRVHCKENLQYPRRIMIDLQPMYSTWGPGVEP